uniref:PWWP domain-containing protein n=1 Tax=Cuerna arida TaxID=1464854 RepID=A0A1B6H1R7_9HEMI
MTTPKFMIGDKVFARMRGYPPWPAKVEGVINNTSTKTIKYRVYFYGTKQIAICKQEDLCSYVENKAVLGKPKKSKGFNDSLLEIDSELNVSFNDSDISKVIDRTNSENMNIEDEVKNDCVRDVCVKIVKYSPVHHNSEDKTKSSEDVGTTVPKSYQSQQSKDEITLRLSLLKNEKMLMDIDYNIQNCLCLNRADPDTCLKQLDELNAMELNSLMIKKHPEIVKTLKNLQVYIGNISCWNMTNEEVEIFSSKALMIQQKSKIIYNKIQSLFSIPFGKTFTEVFEEEQNNLKSYTMNMAPEDFYCLFKDPTNFTVEEK